MMRVAGHPLVALKMSPGAWSENRTPTVDHPKFAMFEVYDSI